MSSRLSDFWVLAYTLAEPAGLQAEMTAAELAMTARQEGAAEEGSEILHLLRTVPASYNIVWKDGAPMGMRTLSELQSILSNVVPESNRDLKAKVLKRWWLQAALQGNEHLLKAKLGMIRGEVKNKSHHIVSTYGFTGFEGAVLSGPTEVLD